MEKFYHQAKNQNWQGRSDTPPNSAFFQIVQLLDLTTLNISAITKNSFALLGFCSDEGVRRNQGRVGAAKGPDEFRRIFAKMPVHSSDISLYDAGDIVCFDEDLESAQHALGEAVALLLSKGLTPILIGGGHEIAYGHYQGISKFISKERLDIVNFDAHLDMRPLLQENMGSSGTPFLQIAQDCDVKNIAFNYHCMGVQKTGNTKKLFEIAKQYNVNILLADLIHQDSNNDFQDFSRMILSKAESIYLTLCLDVFANGFAPGVSAPQPYGLTPFQVVPILRRFASSGKVISYDIAELSPAYDRDHCTAKLASHLVFEILHHHKFRGH